MSIGLSFSNLKLMTFRKIRAFLGFSIFKININTAFLAWSFIKWVLNYIKFLTENTVSLIC